jgi:pimeloyl-ACP methyl ester carboxylesterase
VPSKRKTSDDLRAAAALAAEATTGVTRVVQEMHRTIASGPAILGAPLAGPARALTAVAYLGVRGVTRLVAAGVDRLLAQLEPLLGENAPGPQREALIAALNGVLGDYLQATHNPLAIDMGFRIHGETLPLDRAALVKAVPQASPRVLLLVHGSSMNDLGWTRLGHNHGEALARDLGLTPVGVLYNSGLHVSQNGRALATLLQTLVDSWPVPVQEITLLAHSMGGLVARSACHYGEDLPWRGRLKNLVCLGTPHHGAALERAGNWADFFMTLSRYSAPLAPLAKIRSAGVTDLRFGSVLDEDWEGADRFAKRADTRTPLPLPEGVACFAIAATTARAPRARLPGDGLVSVDSALGKHPQTQLTLKFPEEHQWIGFGMAHLDLLNRAEVYERILGWLQ